MKILKSFTRVLCFCLETQMPSLQELVMILPVKEVLRIERVLK